jgi:hypothetical protein
VNAAIETKKGKSISNPDEIFSGIELTEYITNPYENAAIIDL